MTGSDERAKEIFIEALERPSDERAAFVRDACGENQFLRDEVLSLLRHHREGDEELPAAATISIPEDTPEHIGPYRILRVLGEGGMGVVYLAEQSEPIRRKVALKIIKLGMDTKQIITRFDTERRALALMDHPNVAKVIDAGASDQGRPYFVMELVAGIPITDYCDKQRLTTEERVRLFMDVCHAVQHAHLKGIIHRDIKPSNVLVAVQDDKPVVKVIDFGVAKATEHRLTERTLFTEQGQLIGTPGYMSPEQAEMTVPDIDTRTDVYSLGVLLYELLVGARPFDEEALRRAGFAEIRRIICEVDPPKPSTKFSSLGDDSTTVAQKRGTNPHRLAQMLRGDLDWITMKALEKDRRRRYETANGLALEIQRYLNNEPVLAGPPSRVYRFRKFARRNRAAVLWSTLVVLLLAGSSVGMTALYIRAERHRRIADIARAAEEEQRMVAIANEQRAREEATRAEQETEQARRERDKTQKFAEFMEETLKGVGPSVALGRDTAILKELMDRAAERIESGELASAPEAELRLRLVTGGIYLEIAEFGAAERMLAPVLHLAESVHGQDSVERAAALSVYAKWLDSTGESLLALPKWEESMAIYARCFPGDSYVVATSLSNLALGLHSLGRTEQAISKAKEALALYRRLFSGDHPNVATSLNNVAGILSDLGRSSEALSAAEESLAMRQRLFADDHPDVATSLNNVGQYLQSLGRPTDALRRLEESLAMRRRLFRGDHPSVAISLNNVAQCLISLGRATEALPTHEESLVMRKRLFRGDHNDVATSLNNVAYCLKALGRSEEALYKHEEALAMCQRLYPADHLSVATGINNCASCLRSLSRFEEAASKFEEALSMLQRIFPGDHPYVAQNLNNVAGCLNDMGRAVDALPKYEESLGMLRRLFSGDHPLIANLTNNRGSCLLSLGRGAEGLTAHEEALAMRRRLFSGDHPDVARSLSNVGSCLKSVGRSPEALPKHEEALAMAQRLYHGDHPQLAHALNSVAGSFDSLGRSAEALLNYEEALAMLQRLFSGDHKDVANSLNNVASCLHSLGRSVDALPKLEEAMAMRQRLFSGDHPDVAQSLIDVAGCLDSLGRSVEALPMFEEALAMYGRASPSDHLRIRVAQIGKGRALVSLQRYKDAEGLLVPAWEATADRADMPKRHKVRCLEGIVQLFDAREGLEPGRGHGVEATEWRHRLAHLENSEP